MHALKVCRGRVSALEFSRDGRTLFSSGGRDAAVTAWDVVSREPVFRQAHEAPVLCLALSASGTIGASADRAGAIHLWHASNGELRNILRAELPGVVSLALTPDGSGLAGAGQRAYWWSEPLKVRETDATAFDEDLIPWSDRRAVVVSASPDGRWLAAAEGGRDACYIMRRLGTKFGWTRRTPSAQASAFRFTSDGRWMAVVLGRMAELHEMQDSPDDPASFTSVKRAELRGHTRPIRGIAFHPNGTLLATVSTDGTARLWSVPMGREVQTYDWQAGKLSAVAFARDGFTCALGTEEGRVIVWDVET
jgi:WD40 repeat protein